MQCRVCGFEFDEKELANRGCVGCGKGECKTIHCPNCGFGNSPEFEDEFVFIKNLKDKLSNKLNSNKH